MKLIARVLIVSCFISTGFCKTKRIIGGDAASLGQFPFTVAITITTSDTRYFCGGALISNEWVLTSAVCVDQGISFELQVGSNNLVGDDPNRLVLSTTVAVVHPEFNPDSLQNDIGLIRLRIPIAFTDYIKKIEFQSNSTLLSDTSTIGMGWGQAGDEIDGITNELQYANLTTITLEECRMTYGTQITEDMVCVRGDSNEGLCIGDMGTPLLQSIGAGEYRHVGIASFLSGLGCNTIDPSGYTRTFSYLSWITNVTGIF